MICKKCNLEFSIDNFRRYLVKWKYYLRKECKFCEKEYKKTLIIDWSEQYKKRKEKDIKFYKKYYNSIKASIYYNKNKNYINEKNKLYWKTDKWKLCFRLNTQKRRFFINKTKDNSINQKSIIDLLEKQNYKCAITWNDLIINWELIFHIDHIIPLSKWWPHILSNIQLTTPEANLKKNNKIYFNNN